MRAWLAGASLIQSVPCSTGGSMRAWLAALVDPIGALFEMFDIVHELPR